MVILINSRPNLADEPFLNILFMPLGLIIRDPLQNCWLLLFGIWYCTVLYSFSVNLSSVSDLELGAVSVKTDDRLALPVDSSNKGGRGRLQAQYTGADTGAGNSSRPNFNDRHNLSPDVPKGAGNLSRPN
jgi:hypothetical protein